VIKMQKKDSTAPATTTLDTNKRQENLKLQSKKVHLRNNNSSSSINSDNIVIMIVGFPQSEAQTMPEGQPAHLGWKTI